MRSHRSDALFLWPSKRNIRRYHADPRRDRRSHRGYHLTAPGPGPPQVPVRVRQTRRVRATQAEETVLMLGRDGIEVVSFGPSVHDISKPVGTTQLNCFHKDYS